MKVVVIDDDPTGSQTVHSCPLLLRWDMSTPCAGGFVMRRLCCFCWPTPGR